MSEQKKYSKFEDAIIELLEGELRENALKFASYLNENQLTPKMNIQTDFNYGKIPFGKYYLGWVIVEPNKWLFQCFNFIQFGEYNDNDEGFVTAVHEHVYKCQKCIIDICHGPKDVTIFGKQFKNVCSQHAMDFVNPNDKTLEYIKKLIEYSKKIVPHEGIFHCNTFL